MINSWYHNIENRSKTTLSYLQKLCYLSFFQDRPSGLKKFLKVAHFDISWKTYIYFLPDMLGLTEVFPMATPMNKRDQIDSVDILIIRCYLHVTQVSRDLLMMAAVISEIFFKSTLTVIWHLLFLTALWLILGDGLTPLRSRKVLDVWRWNFYQISSTIARHEI